jgi:hypothetical protein
MPTATAPTRNYLTEGQLGNYAYGPGGVGQNIFGNYASTAGQYGQQDQSNFAALLNSLGINNQQLTGMANTQTADANTALRTGNVADATNLGQSALTNLQQLNPNMYGALNQAQTSTSNPQANTLQDMLNQQAQQGLSLGTSLSAQDANTAQQAARDAWGARGLVNSPGAVGDEVLNTYNMGQQRLQQRQALAQSAGNTSFAQGQVGQQNIYQNAGLQGQYQFNPLTAISGAQTNNAGSNSTLFGQGAGFSSGSFGNQNVNSLVNPYSGYANDVYGTNTNAALAQNIAESNNAAAIQGAQSWAASQILSSLIRGWLGGGTGSGSGSGSGTGSCWGRCLSPSRSSR